MKKIVLFFFLFISTAAFADILVEPYLGLHPFNSRIKTGGTNYTLSGLGFGSRLGFNSYGLMGGVNFRFGSYEIDNLDNKVDLYQHISAFLGYNMENYLRGWLEFIFKSETSFEQNASGTGSISAQDGNGLGFGVGYYGIPYGSINFEFSYVRYAKYSTGASSSDKVTLSMISYSIPFAFPL